MVAGHAGPLLGHASAWHATAAEASHSAFRLPPGPGPRRPRQPRWRCGRVGRAAPLSGRAAGLPWRAGRAARHPDRSITPPALRRPRVPRARTPPGPCPPRAAARARSRSPSCTDATKDPLLELRAALTRRPPPAAAPRAPLADRALLVAVLLALRGEEVAPLSGSDGYPAATTCQVPPKALTPSPLAEPSMPPSGAKV